MQVLAVGVVNAEWQCVHVCASAFEFVRACVSVCVRVRAAVFFFHVFSIELYVIHKDFPT